MNRKEDNHTACLLLHGFTGNPAEMENLALFLRRHGCAVAVPQLPGHAMRPEDLCGVSYRAWLAASENAFHQLQQQHEKVFVIGLSMGGTLALHLAAHHQFAGVVTLAAALRLPLRLEIASYLLAPFVSMRYKRDGSDVHDARAKALLQNYPCYPLSAWRKLCACCARCGGIAESDDTHSGPFFLRSCRAIR
jgi:esterase/lipase